MSKLIDIASAEIGVKEIPGAAHNPRILQYAREAGFEWVNDDETPWCSIFLNWVTHRAGLERTRDARAQSWAEAGTPVNNPAPGDVALFSADGRRIYHVGVYMGHTTDGRFVYVLGGNQSGAVSVAPFPIRQVFGFRRLAQDPSVIFLEELPVEPEEDDTPESGPMQVTKGNRSFNIPQLKLQLGDRGRDVTELQEILVHLGFPHPTPDGVYSTLTARAIRDLQVRGSLKPNGKYNRRTRRYLTSVLMGSEK